ncbi:MAG: hypothetical protein JW913_19170 [Chitinispirillaceae bacterium]|nr:hypothetical protein [Chitinispirillaceae bacterium]
MEGAVTAIRRFLGYVDLLIAGDETAFSEIGQAVTTILADVESIARGRKTREENSIPEYYRSSETVPDRQNIIENNRDNR